MPPVMFGAHGGREYCIFEDRPQSGIQKFGAFESGGKSWEWVEKKLPKTVGAYARFIALSDQHAINEAKRRWGKKLVPEVSRAERAAKNRQLLKHNAARFEKIFGVPLSSYLDIHLGFDIESFTDRVIKPGKSPLEDAMRAKYGKVVGDEAVRMIRELVKREVPQKPKK